MADTGKFKVIIYRLVWIKFKSLSGNGSHTIILFYSMSSRRALCVRGAGIVKSITHNYRFVSSQHNSPFAIYAMDFT